MIKKLVTIAALAMLLGSPASYAAGAVTGNELAGYCEKGAATSQKALCGGYVAGVFDTASGSFICSPKGVTVGQLVSIVTKYFRENPEWLHDNASVLVTAALAEAFPCN
ncbi:Rap1a/Tai family immunity protein [Pseudomonadales bacterium]|jgi:hypothetical protein|nr:Rap1a/Tai family immunity protein [Pseudomonadales bacterium]